MSVWKTLRQEKPKDYEPVIILTRGNTIRPSFYVTEYKSFYTRKGLVRKIGYKRWCRESELVKEILKEVLKEINNK